MNTVRLEKLLIAEVSGVDDPANELPGWMVTKSRSAREVSNTVLDAVRAIIAQPVKLDASPEVIAKAVERFGPGVTNLIGDGSVEVAEFASTTKGVMRHPETGRFHPDHIEADGVPWTLDGAVHPALRKLSMRARGKGKTPPTDTGERSTDAYGSDDPQTPGNTA